MTAKPATKKILDFILNPVICLSVYLVFLLIAQIQVVNWYLGKTQYLLLIWVFVILVYKLIRQREFFRVPGWYFLIALYVSAIISVSLNYETDLTGQLKSIIFLAVSLFFVYPTGYSIFRSKNYATKLTIALLPSQIIIFLQNLAAIATLLAAFSYNGPLQGRHAFLGIQYIKYNSGANAMILFGFNVDSNHAALFSIVGILLTTWIYLKEDSIFKTPKGRLAFKIYYWVNLFVSALAHALYNSRGSRLDIALTMIIVLPLLVYKLTRRDKRTWKRLVVRTLVVLLLAFAVNTQVKVAAEDWSVYHINFMQSLHATHVYNQEPSDTSLNDIAFSKGDALKSARLFIWEETIELWKNQPIFGFGPYNTKFGAIEYNIFGENQYLRHGAAVHNSYLDVLVSYGLVGFLLYSAFFVNLIVVAVRRVKDKGFDISDLVMLAIWLFVMGGVTFLTDSFLGMEYLFTIILVSACGLAGKRYVDSSKALVLSVVEQPQEKQTS